MRYGKSADGSLERSSGGKGSCGLVWLANMQASCSSSASQKVISPYSGSAGTMSTAGPIAIGWNVLPS